MRGTLPARNAALACCPRCTPLRKNASAGSAKARSTTSAAARRSRPPKPTASRRFYALLAFEPRARRVVHVCEDLACMPRRFASALIAELEKHGRAPAITVQCGGRLDDDAVWLKSPCLGLCERAPAGAACTVAVTNRTVERLLGAIRSTALARRAERGARRQTRLRFRTDASAAAGDPSLRLLRRVERRRSGEPRRVPRRGGYVALRRALDIGPKACVREVTDSKLMGRGGAAFPTGRKWDAVAKQTVRPHYLVCNADESEPGTFKDRILMEGDPFAVVEAMTIAALRPAATTASSTLRGEYPLATSGSSERDSPKPAPAACSATISWAAAFRFDIEIARRRGRLHLR
jgi:NADH-quinone oxidoreductase subunit F